MMARAIATKKGKTVNIFVLYALSSASIWALSGLTYFLFLSVNYQRYGSAASISAEKQVLVAFVLPVLSALVNGGLLTDRVLWLIKVLKKPGNKIVLFAWFAATLFAGSYALNFIVFGLSPMFILGKFVNAPSFAIADLAYCINTVLVGFIAYWLMIRERGRSQKISDQEYQLLMLKELNTKAELETLQAKINPHFLYNALNSIASLIHIDPDKAEEMVLLLSKFFRYSTALKNEYYSTVQEEVEIVETYLQVEKVRFDDRLEYFIEYEKGLPLNSLMPRFLLQPIVENAIKHSISRNTETGKIILKAWQEGDRLHLSVHDNGPPFPEPVVPGYGLQSIYEKLRLLCGEEAHMELVNGAYKHVKLVLPIQQPKPEATQTQASYV
jgi:sensor histidine kinase YesM